MEGKPVESRVLKLEGLDHKYDIGHAIAITYGRAVMVIVEGRDGMTGIGRSVPWPEHPFELEKAIQRAHFKARGKLVKARHFRERDRAAGKLAERLHESRERFTAEAAE